MSVGFLLGPIGLFAIAFPVFAAIAITIPWLVGMTLPERWVMRIVRTTFSLDLIACLILVVLVGLNYGRPNEVLLAHWMSTDAYAVDARIVFDVPAVTMMTLTSLLCGLIGVFSGNYLHRDPGFHRFFVLLLLFSSGMMAVSAGDTLDLVFAGWEIVGISSALLIAYFVYREAPVRHGLRAFAIYRTCDVALLTAAVMIHHYIGEASLAEIPELDAGPGLFIALLLVFASMGKAAAFPFTGWLPRAMEGPTPSSAIFYGALSIHAGPYLLIRAWPFLVEQPIARIAIVVIGVVTALHATMVGRVQTDIKTSLGYAAVTQAAIILIEIGCGFTTLAMVHIVGHAVMRTTQLLRAPSVIHDWHELTARLDGMPPRTGVYLERAMPRWLRKWGYRFALERWHLDDLAGGGLLGLIHAVLRKINDIDEKLVEVLSGHDGSPGHEHQGGRS